MIESSEKAEHRADTIMSYGFFAACVGILGGLLTWAVPALEAVRVPFVFYGFLPLAGIGVATVIAGNFYPRGRLRK